MSDSGCEPVFIISVAARLLEMHPQTLRKYEREGLIAPSRTTGNRAPTARPSRRKVVSRT